MDNNESAPAVTARSPSTRAFAAKKKPEKRSFIANLRASSGFLIALGLLITGTGMICFIGFHNQISKLMLDIGMIMCLLGFAIKLLDVCAKIIGGRT